MHLYFHHLQCCCQGPILNFVYMKVSVLIISELSLSDRFIHSIRHPVSKRYSYNGTRHGKS